MDGGGFLVATGYVHTALNALAGLKSLTVTREISLTAIQYFHIGCEVICRSNGKEYKHVGLLYQFHANTKTNWLY